MPQTSDTFASQTLIAKTSNLPGGVSIAQVAFSFGGTAATFNIASPYNNVLAVHVNGAPMQITTGTTLDRITLNNTLNSSGFYQLLAASTNGLDIATPTILQVARSGTNNQDATATIISQGG